MCLKGRENVPWTFVTPASSSSPGSEILKVGREEGVGKRKGERQTDKYTDIETDRDCGGGGWVWVRELKKEHRKRKSNV